MPDMLHGLTEPARLAAAEALVHYLYSESKERFEPVMPDRAAVSRGESLYHRVGCVACHAPLNGVAVASASVPLPQMVGKWSLEGLQKFLVNPLASRPSGRMPSLNLSPREALDLAHYLLRETKVKAPLEFTQFRNRVRALDELDSAELARTGPAPGITLAMMGKDRGFAIRLSGWLKVEKAAEYTFYLTASGAGRLNVDGGWYLGEDSWEREEVDGNIKLTLGVGQHELKIDYVHRGSKDPAVQLEWAAPGLPRQPVPVERLSSESEPVLVPPPFVVEETKVAEGKGLYASLRCAACHENGPVAGKFPALDSLHLERGCLADDVPAGAPRYRLTTAQRGQIRTSIAALNQAKLDPPDPKQRLAGKMECLNCVACHVRDGVGGVKQDRDAFFTSNGEDLGDEGRIPPGLDAVGNKLQSDWLTNVLVRAAAVRPYFNTRMPQFGEANVAELPGLFSAIDRQAKPLEAIPDSRESLSEAGRKLTGTDGLSCIACHKFNRQPAHALQVIDLTTVTQRLHEDWFQAFLLDPNRYHPGTRMPAFWPDGVSPLPALLGGNMKRQQHALWTYFAEGSRARFPEGLSRQSMELIVGGEPVLYRGKLREAGFRAVAVGYPGQVNLAFDAEEMRLSELWRGRFLNAGPHWSVQGMGQIQPLGTDAVVFPHQSPLAVLADSQTPWPTNSSKALGMKFRGYQIDSKKRPTLLYSFHGLDVEDYFLPLEQPGKTGFHRTLTFKGECPKGITFRLSGGPVAPVGQNAWRIQDRMTLTLVTGGQSYARGSRERQDILVPLEPSTNNRTLEVEYVW